MASGLDMSLDDMISKNRKSNRPGPARRIPSRQPNRSAPYPSAKAPEISWNHDLFSDHSAAAALETGTKIYISNLDYGVSNEDLKELFVEVGDLKRYTVHYDRSGRSKGTAEVVFSRRVDALAAVKKYNNIQLDGKPMKMEIVGTNLPTAKPLNTNSNGASGRGRQGRGNGRGGRRQGGGRRSGKAPAEKISAEDLDADLDKYHSAAMQTDL